MKRFVYADNAATTKLDIDAFEAMRPYLLNEYGNASQPYSFARKPKQALKEAREIIAQCINAEPEEIYFTSGGTESDNWAIKGFALGQPDKPAIVTSQIEHHAVLRACESIEKLGYPVVYIPVTREGIISSEILESFITDTTGLVSIMFANNEIGTVENIKELCKIAHMHGALFHTDAVQAVGHLIIDVKELAVDMLSASAHKFNGPKGVGFLYIKNGIQISQYASGGSQESGFRAGTENVASIVGMAVALKKNYDMIADNTRYLESLEKRLFDGISGLDFIKNGHCNRVPGNVSLSFKNLDGEALLHRLDLMGICVSTGAACDTVNTQVSHVLKAIGLSEDYAKGTIRISLSKDNSLEDVDYIASALRKIVYTM